ncbi:9279_t:CDS:2 [Funneliformis caledonium]|uniref:9279_t:CDS:1 n=1 Tax=Funneliformis caledonium TaxID=1117310 RepID=A0A9N9H3H6_9GLOM|nr:9279_t:CDS:2 [Funneliformis caledonium]
MSSRRDYDRSRSPSSRSKSHRVHLREGNEGEYKPRKEKKHKKIHDHLDTDSNNSHKQPKGFQSISEDDYFSKSTEFRIWLRENKDKFFDELSSNQAHRYFKKFISSWNKCKLDKTTRYKWKNLKINQDELDSLKHSIDRQTNTKFAMEVQMRSGKTDQINKRTIGPTMPPTSLQGGNEEMDQEDRERYERTLKRKERKDFQKTHEAVLDELIPKATGKEAMIEKKRTKNAYYRREESPDVELNERDLMGDDDFRSSFAAQKRASDAREQRKQAYKAEKAASLQEKAIAYKSKEQDTMEMFRRLAEEQRKAGRGMWSKSNNDNDS